MRLLKFACVAFFAVAFSVACQKEKPEKSDPAEDVELHDGLCGTGWLAKAPAVWDGDGGVLGNGDYYLYFLDGGACIMHSIVAYGPLSVIPIGLIARGNYSISSSPGASMPKRVVAIACVPFTILGLTRAASVLNTEAYTLSTASLPGSS